MGIVYSRSVAKFSPSNLFHPTRLDLKVNVIAFVPSIENMPGPTAFKPGDVYTARFLPVTFYQKSNGFVDLFLWIIYIAPYL